MSEVEKNGADTVILERAERFLPEAAQNPPVMSNPGIALQTEPARENPSELLDCQVQRQGNFFRICGRLPEDSLDTESRIFVRVDHQNCLEAFPMDLPSEGKIWPEGYCLHLPQEIFHDSVHLEVMTEKGGGLTIVTEGDLELPGTPKES